MHSAPALVHPTRAGQARETIMPAGPDRAAVIEPETTTVLHDPAPVAAIDPSEIMPVDPEQVDQTARAQVTQRTDPGRAQIIGDPPETRTVRVERTRTTVLAPTAIAGSLQARAMSR